MAHSTKLELAEALRALLAERSLDKITVQDVADAAQVSRKTFYYHFQDMYDLLEWMLEQERKMLEPHDADRSAWRDSVVRLLDLCLKNKPVILNLYRSISRDTLDRHIYSIVLMSLQDFAQTQAGRQKLTEKQYNALLQFAAHGLQGLLLSWIDSGMRQPREEILETVDFLFDLQLGNHTAPF